MIKTLVALLLAALATVPALAAEHVFTVTNRTEAAVTQILVQGGQVVDFKRIPANGERPLTLTLPDGVCTTRLTIVFDDSDSIDFGTYDACNSGGLDLG